MWVLDLSDTIVSHSNVLNKPGFKLVGVAAIGKKMRGKAKTFRYLRR